MKQRWQALLSKHWNNRPAQERRVINITCLILLPIVYYYLFWQPAHQAVGKLHKALPTLQAQLSKMQDQSAEVEMLHHRPEVSVLDSAALKSTIEESLSRHQLSPLVSFLELQEPNGIRINCEAISFSVLITWLHDLEKEQHIRAQSISISPLAQSGMVKISASLSNRNSN